MDELPALLADTRSSLPRPQILSVYDLPHETAIKSLRRLYMDAHPKSPRPDASVLEAVVNLVGGRTSYLNRCARSEDMLEEAKFMVRSEREWILSKIGLMCVSPPSSGVVLLPPSPPLTDGVLSV